MKKKHEPLENFKWFDIKKYDRAKDLDAQGWLDQLMYRHSIQNSIHNDLLESEIKRLEKHGIVDIQPLEEPIPTLMPKNKAKPETSAVRFITRAEAYKFYDTLRLDENEKQLYYEVEKKQDCIEQIRSIFKNESNEEFQKLKNEPFDLFIKDKKNAPLHPFNPYANGDWAHVAINLSASDEKITDDFKKWLAEARSKLGIYKGRSIERGLRKLKDAKFSNEMFSKWASDRVLAYIDLRLWAGFYNVKITAEEIIQIIYPGDASIGRPKIDEKIKPLADTLLSIEILVKLGTYVRGNLKNK